MGVLFAAYSFFQKALCGADLMRGEVLMPNPRRIRQFERHMAVGRRVLDMGTGSGVLARLALDKGAMEVVAADINPHAVEMAAEAVPEATVVRSDLFEKVDGKFDTIIFAAPWSEGEISRPFHHAVFDTGVVGRFLREAKAHLAAGGSLWVQHCDESRERFGAFNEAVQTHGYRVEGRWSYLHLTRFAPKLARVYLYRLGPP